MADNKIEITPGTSVLFADDDHGSENVILNLTSLGDGSGEYSGRHDLGAAGARPAHILLSGECQCVATPTQGEIAKLYVGWWDDDQNPMANLATTASTGGGLTDDMARNLYLVSTAEAETATANKIFTFRNVKLEVLGRYITIGVINDMGAAFTADNVENFITLTPFPFSIE